MLTNNQDKNPKKPLVTNFIRNLLPFGVRTQKGSTLPMAIGLGSAMMIVGAVAVMKSGQENTNTISSEQTQQAIASAEAGVTRIQELFAQEPGLAIYPACLGDATTAAGYDCETPENNSWVNITENFKTKDSGSGGTGGSGSGIDPNANYCTIPTTPISSGSSTLTDDQIESIETKVADTDVVKINASEKKSDWVNIGNGSYKLVAYDYDQPGNANGNGLGTLVIQGKAGNSSNPAIAEIAVNFPVQATTNIGGGGESEESPAEIGGGPPGLWARDFGNLNNSIYAHVLDSSDCLYPTNNSKYLGAQTGGQFQNPTTLALISPLTGNGSVRKQGVAFPPLPNNGIYTAPTGSVVSGNVRRMTDGTYFNVTGTTAINAATTFPRINDRATDGTVYTSGTGATGKTYIYHMAGGINTSGNAKVITWGRNGTETFKVYSDGVINIGGNATNVMGPFKNTTTQNTSKVRFYLNNNITLRGNGNTPPNVSDYQFYVYGNRSITVGGNAEITAFIFAPDSTVTLNGAGGTSDILSGALWAKSFNASGNHANFKQKIVNTDLPNLEVQLPSITTTSGSETYEFSLGSPSGWRRQAKSN